MTIYIGSGLVLHEMVIRVENRKDPDQTASVEAI